MNKKLWITDRKAGGKQQNNYVKKIEMMAEAGLIPKGELSRIDILHDEDCAVFAGGFCGCNPDIIVKPFND